MRYVQVGLHKQSCTQGSGFYMRRIPSSAGRLTSVAGGFGFHSTLSGPCISLNHHEPQKQQWPWLFRPLTLFASWAGGRKKNVTPKCHFGVLESSFLLWCQHLQVSWNTWVLDTFHNGINACCLFCFSDCYAQNPRQHLRRADLYTSQVIAY